MADIILEQRRGPVLLLTLNDPERANPLSPSLMAALTDALKRAADTKEVRAVVLCGAGKHFSAGADLAALEQLAAGGDEASNRQDSERLVELFRVLLGHCKLTVAAVQGAAIAGGCGLATACDLVVAGRSSRFCYTEVKIGFLAAVVSTFLTRRVAGHVARRMLLDPEMLAAEEAAAVGLIDRVVEDGEATDQAVQWATAVTRKGSPSALAATKRLLNQCVGLGWEEALDLAARANVEQRMEADCKKGVRCFLEHKRTPDWLEE